MQNLLFPSRQHAESRRKATSARRVLRPARSNLGGTDRTMTDFRNLREHLARFSLPIELFLPHGSSCLSSVGTELCASPPARWERVSSFDGLTVLVIRTDMTYTVTRQTTLLLPPAGPQNALDKSHTHEATRTTSRSSDRRARSMSERQGQARRAAKQSGATSRASACARAPSQRCRDRVGQSPLPTPRDLIGNGALMSCESCVGSARGHSRKARAGFWKDNCKMNSGARDAAFWKDDETT